MRLPEIIPELISAALENRRIAPVSDMDPETWENILGICVAQRIHTFVYDALPLTGVPDDIMTLWSSHAAANERISRRLDAIVRAQQERWDALELRYALIKGPAIAQLYPNPLHRGCGDIDWWFADERSWNEALKPAIRNAMDGIHTDSDGDIHYIFKGVVIEHHRDWTHLASRSKRRIASNADFTLGRLCPEDTILLLMCHILHHAAWEGVNLKQIVDLAVALKSYDGQFDKAHLRSRLKKLGLSKWASLLACVLPELTGIAAECIPAKAECSEANRERLLNIIFAEKCSFSRRLALMLSCSASEAIARYFYLASGRAAIALSTFRARMRK